jgi:hypothetical protein
MLRYGVLLRDQRLSLLKTTGRRGAGDNEPGPSLFLAWFVLLR